MTRHTVVACDTGPASEAALDWAIHRSHWVKDPIVLVHVVEETTLVPGKVLTPERFERAKDLLAIAASRIGDAITGVDVRTEILTGEVVPTLIEYTSAEDLLVVGEKGPTAGRLMAGWSTGVRVASHASGPVAVVPSGVSHDRSGIVVGVDDSEECLEVARIAAREALATGQALHVVHAWRAPGMWLDSFPLDDEFMEDIARPHHALVNDIVTILRQEHPSLDVSGRALHGEPARCLLQNAPLPSLVFVGTRSQSPFAKILLGSVSRDVLLNLDVPAIIVPVGHSVAERRPHPESTASAS